MGMADSHLDGVPAMRKTTASSSSSLNIAFLLSMVATNLLSLYHLSTRASTAPPLLLPAAHQAQAQDEQLLRQLTAIRATVSQLNHLRSSTPPPPPPPPELLLYSRLAPLASACSAHPDLLHRFMSYTPFSPCPDDALSLAEPLLLRGCHPLPRRRCFSSSSISSSHNLNNLPTDPFSPLPDSAVRWPPGAKCTSFSCLPPSLGFDLARREAARFLRAEGPLDLTVPQLLRLASLSRAGPIRLGLDVGGGTGTLAARLKRAANATVLTTTMDLGAPYSEAAAARGVVPLHAPLQQRFPVGDATMDLVRAGHAVNRWIPEAALEFLWYDADRVLRPRGLLWVDHFWCRRPDLAAVYQPMLRRLGYKTLKWAVADKTTPTPTAPPGAKHDHVYLTALLQKP
uniref:Methyltransferase type 11 domain-containing protein n=1 Tax=Oryza nivara TaxID=4536 RepID=A0A0E0JAS8_ORYNI